MIKVIFPLNITVSKYVSYLRGDLMSYKNHLDPQSERFHHTWTRRKHTKSQVNGETQVTQNTIILRSNAKSHFW
ncbi:YpzG family protein [Heyndrickxia sp. NPDC080065]|uniref:YpzG family protein n=1 Tax=Heyndrickxia sp. NPDC080065 TaxID=3390568 RepID=UPI003D054778